ncbi:MAG: hypothetical protein AAF394_04805 [Planctomycetota bacterium]
MGKPTRKTLPKDLDKLFEAAESNGDYTRVYKALERCLPDALGGYGKGTILIPSLHSGSCKVGN